MGKESRRQMRWLRANGDGIDPDIGVAAAALTVGRIPGAGVRIYLRNERNAVLASIDYEPTDVRALRDALSRALRVMGD